MLEFSCFICAVCDGGFFVVFFFLCLGFIWWWCCCFVCVVFMCVVFLFFALIVEANYSGEAVEVMKWGKLGLVERIL